MSFFTHLYTAEAQQRVGLNRSVVSFHQWKILKIENKIAKLAKILKFETKVNLIHNCSFHIKLMKVHRLIALAGEILISHSINEL